VLFLLSSCSFDGLFHVLAPRLIASTWHRQGLQYFDVFVDDALLHAQGFLLLAYDASTAFSGVLDDVFPTF
jgi:hypothetical protein